MPAPKKFNPGPTTSPSYSTGFGNPRIKGRHAVVPPPPKPGIAPDDAVEVDVDEVAVIMRGSSKYESRSLNAHVEPVLSIDLDDIDDIEEAPEPVAPVHAPAMVFGEWRSESGLEGTHYHRKDSRRI